MVKKSAHDRYLFVQSPNGPSGSAREYFAPDNQLPPLVQSGFNPSFITTLSHEKVQVIRVNLKFHMVET